VVGCDDAVGAVDMVGSLLILGLDEILGAALTVAASEMRGKIFRIRVLDVNEIQRNKNKGFSIKHKLTCN
jgi:hypothetical protein